MNRSIFGRLLLSLIVLSWALYNMIPYKDTPFDTFVKEKVTDKKSGFERVYNVAQKRVKSGRSPSIYVSLSQIAKEKQIDLSQFFTNINLSDVKNLDKRNELLLQYLLKESQGKIRLGLDLKGGVAFTLKVDDSALEGKQQFEQEQQLHKAIDIMDRRINGLGVAEPIIRARGTDQLEIQLPGLSTEENPDVVSSLQKPAKLTFHLVNRFKYPENTASGEEPIGYTVMSKEEVDPRTGEVHTEKLFIKKIPEMSGGSIKNAYASINNYGGYEIALNMTTEGAERFAVVTKKIADDNNSAPYSSLPDNHPAKYGRLAIVLDGKLYSAPRVTEVIPSGRARISGQFSQRDAVELSNVLNNPLEFELKLTEMYEVGPSLAEDARTSSINASILGAALVIAFMVIYYSAGGVLSVIALGINVIAIVGIQSSINATLTLPGVAALVLTIGMAVDANILIFERIREELKAGKSIKAAIDAGFDRAFATILDANITTLLTAVILIWLGNGPIKGFGVTLSIGILTTLFTVLVTFKALIQLFVNTNIIKKLLPFTMFKAINFDYIKHRSKAYALTVIVFIAGVIAVVVNKDRIYSIDFVGGDELTLQYTEKLGINTITEIAKKNNLGEVVPVYQRLLGTDHEVLKLQTEHSKGQAILNALNKAYPNAKLNPIGETSIGGTVSESIKTNALLAIGIALLGILLYVAFRFEWGYGFGAFVSTLHDVILTIGIYVLLGGQFSASMVAAILMIIGYSINDTIVVFDRIREELNLNTQLKLSEVINLAINRTLSRTILTSLTTFLAALALYIFGVGVVSDFALVFLIGIVTGTFSSIFIASPIFFWWHKGNRAHVTQAAPRPSYPWEISTKISKINTDTTNSK